MSSRSGSTVLMFLITFIFGFTAGVGVSYWDKVEWITVAFYTAVLVGLVWGGFELLRAMRAYRQAMAHRLYTSSRVFAARVRMPALPRPEVLQLDSEFINTVEVSEELG
jgi:hypothetical protein